jgi:carboxyl-terminal processing protease
MTLRRKRLLSALVVIVAVAATVAGPALAARGQRLAARLDTLSRMFDIIEAYYVEDVEADQLFQNAVTGMLDELDPHSHYYSSEEYKTLRERYRGDYHGIGIQFDIFDGILTVLDALEGGPSEKLGLRPGDQIVKIRGETAIGLDNDEIYELLRGPRGTRVEVTVRRPALDEEWNVDITRDEVEVPAVLASTMFDSGVGYVWLSTFSEKGADQLERSLAEFETEGMTAFILDLRGNRGGLMSQAIRITDKFLDGGKQIVETRGKAPNSESKNYSTERDTHPRVPMIVLVDHSSASASEIVAGALQDWDRALVVGQLTWGKALVQNQFEFNDGSALFLTIARYYTPSGRLIQRPYVSGDDIDYMAPDWEAIYATRDEGALPEFATSAGRKVLGGGGIMPDVEIDPSQASGLAVWLYNRRYTFQFATRYVSENAATIPATFAEYRDDFRVDDATLDAFVEFLNWPSIRPTLDDAGVPLDDESLDAARDDLRMYLAAHIAANVWGLEAGRVVLLDHDGQVQGALGLLPQAADLLSLGPVDTAGL